MTKYLEAVALRKLDYLAHWFRFEGHLVCKDWHDCIDRWLAGDSEIKGFGLCDAEREVIRKWKGAA